MSALFSYSLAVSLIATLLFPMLWLQANRCTFFRFNRSVLISSVLLSLVFPFIIKGISSVPLNNRNIDITDSVQTVIPAMNPESVASHSSPLWIAVAVTIYFVGGAILLSREMLSFVRLFRLVARSEKIEHHGYIFCRLKEPDIAPFSWRKYIFLNDTEFDDMTDSIVLHEKAHADSHHWLDVLFVDLYCILLWYNPFVWLIRRLVRLNHEFEADSAVIHSGIDTNDYQRLLVLKAIERRSIAVANSFAADSRDFRTRVLKIGKRRSSSATLFIAALAFPAVTFAGITVLSPVSTGFLTSIADYRFEKTAHAPSRNEMSDPLPVKEEISIDENADSMIVLPSPLNDQTALAKVINVALSTINPDKETKINIGIVVDEEGRVTEVVTDNTDDPLVKAIVDQAVNGIRFEQMTQNGQPIKLHFRIPVTIKAK